MDEEKKALTVKASQVVIDLIRDEKLLDQLLEYYARRELEEKVREIDAGFQGDMARGGKKKTFYLTFGRAHRHVLNRPEFPEGIYFDKDCVVQIFAKNADDAQEIAFMVFGERWGNIYDELPDMEFFPRGTKGPVFKRGIPYNVRHLIEAKD